ncbi:MULTISPECIES: cysteine hydrolase family protein [Aeromonas]|uniref:cysteine hydrolase family protein n=1 Tax=Aeromonas TaxID=642 RepID=UPI0012F259D1|nr:isochorismatase family cysteine hydrolase [Aeromonas salmonicida]VXA77213.1 Isochorismatase [Aeromonas salmonicida]
MTQTSNQALLVIDFINDIVHPQGKLASCAAHSEEQQAIHHANQAISYARERGWKVIFVKIGFEPHYHAQPKHSPMFGKAHQYKALMLGSIGTDFHEALDVDTTSDIIISKPRVNPFYATSLEAVLRANNVSHLWICGVSTEWAIQSAVRDAHDRDYEVTVLEDACAAGNASQHQHSITMLSRIARIMTVEEMLSAQP